jgi:hypothetical protein
MNYVSAAIRIVCGLVLVILAASTYLKGREHIGEGTRQVQIFGFATSAEPWQLALAFGTVGLIGLVLIGLGFATLLRKS